MEPDGGILRQRSRWPMAASGNGGGGGSVGGGLVTLAVSENSTTFFVCSAAPQTAGVVPVVLAWVSCAVVRTS